MQKINRNLGLNIFDNLIRVYDNLMESCNVFAVVFSTFPKKIITNKVQSNSCSYSYLNDLHYIMFVNECYYEVFPWREGAGDSVGGYIDVHSVY